MLGAANAGSKDPQECVLHGRLCVSGQGLQQCVWLPVVQGAGCQQSLKRREAWRPLPQCEVQQVLQGPVLEVGDDLCSDLWEKDRGGHHVAYGLSQRCDDGKIADGSSFASST